VVYLFSKTIFGAVCGLDKLRILNYNRYVYSKNIINSLYEYSSYKIKHFYEFFVNKSSFFKIQLHMIFIEKLVHHSRVFSPSVRGFNSFKLMTGHAKNIVSRKAIKLLFPVWLFHLTNKLTRFGKC